MKLPNRKFAYISNVKLVDYLLSETHPVGRSKARFFRSFGFDETNLDLLRERLITIAQSCEVQYQFPSPHGEKYIIDGLLKTPDNRSAKIRTVWIIDKNQDKPRFIIAYPN
ncbi:MAG: DUF6883 domain-containing protein [Candidatus Anammoxibacter sp.]